MTVIIAGDDDAWPGQTRPLQIHKDHQSAARCLSDALDQAPSPPSGAFSARPAAGGIIGRDLTSPSLSQRRQIPASAATPRFVTSTPRGGSDLIAAHFTLDLVAGRRINAVRLPTTSRSSGTLLHCPRFAAATSEDIARCA